MTIDEIIKTFEEPFNVPDLAGSWYLVLEAYRQCGFELPLNGNGHRMSDDEIVQEFAWVHGQYRKFIGRTRSVLKTDDLMDYTKLDQLIEWMTEALAKDNDVPDNRKMLVYQVMKTQWLDSTISYLKWLSGEAAANNNDEGVEDEW